MVDSAVAAEHPQPPPAPSAAVGAAAVTAAAPGAALAYANWEGGGTGAFPDIPPPPPHRMPLSISRLQLQLHYPTVAAAESRRIDAEFAAAVAAEESAAAVAAAAPVAQLAIEDAAPTAAVAAAAPAAAVAAAAPFAAVAAAVQPANDGQPAPQVFDLDYFRAFRPFTGGWRQHNAALKFFRWQQELPDDPLQSPCLEFHASAPTAVGVIDHSTKGMTWKPTDEWTQWSWHEMIAQLDEPSMEEVVNGPSGRSGGLVGCSFAIRPGSYDHKRHHMLRQTDPNPPEKKLPIWDFVVHREDGSGIRLHPEWSKPLVETFEEPGHAEALAVVTVPPRSGLGRSDGRGTYKKYKNISGTKNMQFDKAKKP